MSRFTCLIILPVLFVSGLSAQRPLNNTFGISMGFTPGITDLYIGNPMDIWPSRLSGTAYHIFYSVGFGDFLRAGPYYEYEQVRFSESITTGIYGFDRYNIGINWLGQFLKGAFHLQLGGYLGYGFLKARNWDRLTGFDLGMMAGPAYELKRFGAAIHIETGHAKYKSGGTPSDVVLYSPRILLKAYYRFSWSDVFGKG